MCCDVYLPLAMSHPESSSQVEPEVPELLQEIPEITEGTRIKLQKIDPKTHADIPQSVNLTGLLCSGKVGREPRIRVGHRIFVDTSHDLTANSTSSVKKIERFSDGTYHVHTGSSVYRLTRVTEGQTGKQAAEVPQRQEVRSSLADLFHRIKKKLGGD